MAMYMKIDGIDGEVTSKGHEKWIDVSSLQWGVGRAISSSIGSSSNREASKPSISEVSVTKALDQSSPLIFTEACIGKGKTVLIHLCTVGSDNLETYLEYELTDCMISGYSVSSGGDRPSESCSLSFTKMMMKFNEFDKNGKQVNSVTSGYNMSTGESV